MDRTHKMVAQASKFQKGRDDAFRFTKATPPAKPEPAPVAAAPKQQSMAVLYPEKLQIPVTMQQEILLSTIAKQLQANRNRGKIGQREGESINKGTIVRCLIRLLEDVQVDAADRPLSEDQVFNLLKTKLGIK